MAQTPRKKGTPNTTQNASRMSFTDTILQQVKVGNIQGAVNQIQKSTPQILVTKVKDGESNFELAPLKADADFIKDVTSRLRFDPYLNKIAKLFPTEGDMDAAKKLEPAFREFGASWQTNLYATSDPVYLGENTLDRREPMTSEQLMKRFEQYHLYDAAKTPQATPGQPTSVPSAAAGPTTTVAPDGTTVYTDTNSRVRNTQRRLMSNMRGESLVAFLSGLGLLTGLVDIRNDNDDDGRSRQPIIDGSGVQEARATVEEVGRSASETGHKVWQGISRGLVFALSMILLVWLLLALSISYLATYFINIDAGFVAFVGCIALTAIVVGNVVSGLTSEFNDRVSMSRSVTMFDETRAVLGARRSRDGVPGGLLIDGMPTDSVRNPVTQNELVESLKRNLWHDADADNFAQQLFVAVSEQFEESGVIFNIDQPRTYPKPWHKYYQN